MYSLFGDQIMEKICILILTGRCQRADKQKQKGYRKFPPASSFALVLRNENSLKKSYVLPEVTNYVIFVLITICSSPQPFSGKQHQKAPLSDISPLVSDQIGVKSISQRNNEFIDIQCPPFNWITDNRISSLL